jgi:N-acetylglutamate synthase-like GNAT family acetyltransferase
MNNNYTLRKAKQEDLEEIVRLLGDDKFGKERENSSSPNYLNAFLLIEKDPNQFLMVLEKNKAIIGTCHLTLMPSLTFQGSLRMNIEAVRIDTSMRGQGAGEWMIDRAIQFAKEKGCKMVQLTTNKQRLDAKRFYEKMGFQATHEGMKLYL